MIDRKGKKCWNAKCEKPWVASLKLNLEWTKTRTFIEVKLCDTHMFNIQTTVHEHIDLLREHYAVQTGVDAGVGV